MTKPKNVIDRVSRILVDQPLTVEELKALESIERRRQEGEADLRVAITPEQKTKAYAKSADAGARALDLARRVAERIESKRANEVMREIEQLAQLRGDDLEEVSTGARLRMSPLLRLHNARLITDEQFAAGRRYGDTWARLYAAAKGNGAGGCALDPLDARLMDLVRLDEARGYRPSDSGGKAVVASGLGGDARLVSICDRVCGAELSLREVFGISGAKRRQGMERLRDALGKLALFYGLIKTHQDELRAA